MRTMDNLLLLIIGIALFAFLWGVFRYLRSYNNEKERSASVSYMTYGLISLLVIVSMWGFVYLLANTIGVRLGTGNTGVGGSSPSKNTSKTVPNSENMSFDELDKY